MSGLVASYATVCGSMAPRPSGAACRFKTDVGYTDTLYPRTLTPEFDALLEGRGLRLEAIRVGGNTRYQRVA